MRSDVICLTIGTRAVYILQEIRIARVPSIRVAECSAHIILVVSPASYWLSDHLAIYHGASTREVHAVAAASKHCDRQSVRRRRDSDL